MGLQSKLVLGMHLYDCLIVAVRLELCILRTTYGPFILDCVPEFMILDICCKEMIGLCLNCYVVQSLMNAAVVDALWGCYGVGYIFYLDAG